ncbi:MAG TPA: urate hydroxylase PuuD [Gemmatimonadales bacterium]|nr:urate hydroxylase PuuD [Gemmatimonadales bacterium]
MTSWLADWANLLLRWTHFVAGIAWIGSSFYFIWLDRTLTAPAAPRPGVEGDLWMVHSGGFYQVEKRKPGPGEVPPVLHWFKWEALFTWISGVALLILVYYLSNAYLLDPGDSRISRGAATAIGVGILVGGWLVYDWLWSSSLARRGPGAATTLALVLLAVVTYLVCRLLSGRAAFMHVGSLLGTIMVLNVWLRILPAQREMLAATRAGRAADFTLGERAKLRSVHNSYMTFPLLFIMLSNHYPSTYASRLNWLVFLFLFVAGAAMRHAMIGRGSSSRWAILPAALGLAGAMFFSTTGMRGGTDGADGADGAGAAGDTVGFAAVRSVIAQRCQPCHSQYQTDRTFGPAPGGVTFDTPESIARQAERIRIRAIETRTMPIANKTGMTDQERSILARWIQLGAPLR